MSVDFRIELKEDYVHLYCRGTFTLVAILEVYRQAFDIAARENRKAVLVDCRAVEGEPPTTMERYEQGVAVAKLQQDAGAGIWMSVLGQPPLLDEKRFGETVALNRGASGGVFNDVDAAVEVMRKWVHGE